MCLLKDLPMALSTEDNGDHNSKSSAIPKHWQLIIGIVPIGLGQSLNNKHFMYLSCNFIYFYIKYLYFAEITTTVSYLHWLKIFVFS